MPLTRIGRIQLGDLGTLDLWWVESYGVGLFLPMLDATSGVTTYSGGRYLCDTANGAYVGGMGNSLIVDLNYAYQPPCAYDESLPCLLPDEGNRLEAAVPVGELL